MTSPSGQKDAACGQVYTTGIFGSSARDANHGVRDAHGIMRSGRRTWCQAQVRSIMASHNDDAPHEIPRNRSQAANARHETQASHAADSGNEISRHRCAHGVNMATCCVFLPTRYVCWCVCVLVCASLCACACVLL